MERKLKTPDVEKPAYPHRAKEWLDKLRLAKARLNEVLTTQPQFNFGVDDPNSGDFTRSVILTDMGKLKFAGKWIPGTELEDPNEILAFGEWLVHHYRRLDGEAFKDQYGRDFEYDPKEPHNES